MTNDPSPTRSAAEPVTPLDSTDTPSGTDSFATLPPGVNSPPLEGPDLGRYEFQSTLGQGGMGVVYRVLDRSLDRVVALKVIRADALTPGLRSRFAEEARAVARLSHPHIIQVFDFGETVPPGEAAPVPFLTLEYVERGSLAASLSEGLPLAPALAAQLVARIARGMQHAHDRGIVHRDLKPENVLLAATGDLAALDTPLGCPKVTDFGLARLVQADRRLTQPGAVMGTPAYMAPEQAEGLSDVGPAADVYAMGVIVYRLLTGKVPFASDSLTKLLYQICHETPVPPRRVRAEVPEELERICMRCLEKDPQNRPPMGEVASRLERWLASNARIETVTLVAPPKKQLGRRALLLAGVVALVVGGLALAAFKPKEKEPEDESNTVTKANPLTIKPIRVMHYATVGKEEEPRGRIGDESLATRVGDGATLTVELSGPAYFYVIAFNCDGKEDLVWPGNESGSSPAAMPPRLARLHYPSGKNRLDLGDDDKGGLQVYVVVASPDPLPPYADWRKVKAGIRWKPWPAGRAAWVADAKGVYPLSGGLSPDRSGLRKARGILPLDELCQALGGEGLVVEAIAFGVLPKEEK